MICDYSLFIRFGLSSSGRCVACAVSGVPQASVQSSRHQRPSFVIAAFRVGPAPSSSSRRSAIESRFYRTTLQTCAEIDPTVSIIRRAFRVWFFFPTVAVSIFDRLSSLALAPPTMSSRSRRQQTDCSVRSDRAAVAVSTKLRERRSIRTLRKSKYSTRIDITSIANEIRSCFVVVCAHCTPPCR